MAYESARRYPSRLATAASGESPPTLIDGLEVVGEQVVVLSAPDTRADDPRPVPRLSARRGRRRVVGQ